MYRFQYSQRKQKKVDSVGKAPTCVLFYKDLSLAPASLC